MRKSTVVVGLVVSAMLLACSSQDEAVTEAEPGSTASAQSAVERCDGAFRCAGPTGEAETRLERHDGACYAGGLRLDPGGTVTADGLSASWSETDTGFEVCADGECIQCASNDPVPPVPATPGASSSPKSKGSCSGVASSCWGRAAGSCAGQQGCYGGSRIRWNGNLEFECKGSPRSCSSFSSRTSCEQQLGCGWKP
ncbi:MAG: hypothetical protein KF894_10365 [Labilithrix sp.]|nr:hypothetical protein [Labilithrix sp.]